MKINKWLTKNTYDLSNKVIAFLGCSGGLGSLVSKQLAYNNANLILLGSNEDKLNKQKQHLLELNNKIKINILKVDLANIDETKQVSEQLKTMNVDILILGSGVYNVPKVKTVTGFNNIFQINFLSQYYIAKQLLPNLQKRNGKIVAISSVAHRYSQIDENDIDFSTRKKPSKIYGNSKRYLTFALFELLKEYKDVSLSIVHPGVTLTKMTNHYPKAINWLVKLGIKLLFPSPNWASLSIIKGVFDSTTTNQWIGPKIFDVWGKPTKKILKSCADVESKKIYKIAENCYNKLV